MKKVLASILVDEVMQMLCEVSLAVGNTHASGKVC